MNKKKVTLLLALLAVAAYGEESIDLGKSVIYSTTGFATEMRKTAANPTLITSEEIQKKNYTTVDEILRDIPAINIVKQGKDSIIDLRGQGEKAKQNVQILVDGVQMNSLDTSMAATPINTISPDSIERIEVIPGGGSVLYGSGTSGGVVNIITKKNAKNKVIAGYEYGSYANKKATVSVGQKLGDLTVDLSYTNLKKDGYRDYDKTDSDAFNGSVGYKISDDQNINFKYSKYKSDESYPSMLTRKQLEEDRKQSGLYSGRLGKEINTSETDKDEYVLSYNNNLTNNLDFNLTGFYQKTTMKVKTSNLGDNVDMEMPRMTRIPTKKLKGDSFVNLTGKFEDKKWGIKPKLKYSYGEGSSLILGMDYINNKATRLSDNNIKNQFRMGPMLDSMNIHSITTNNLEKETISAYIMNNYVWNNFEFAQGIRYEKANYKTERLNKKTVTPPEISRKPSKTTYESKSFSTDDNNLAYELSANWLYSDTGKTYVRYERGFTSAPPSLLTNKLPNGDYVLNDLEAEKYDNFEVGLSDYVGFTSINTSVFYTVTKDEITQDMSGGMPPKWIYNYNLGKTQRVGFELKTEQSLDKLTLSQSYSYINTKIKEGGKGIYDKNGKKTGETDLSGNHIANVPEHKLNLGAEYAFTPKFTVGGEVVYMSGIYVNNENKGGKVNSHTVANVRANYSFDNGLDIYAGVNNLFDKKYYEDVDYNSKDGYTYDPAAERNYYVGFRYSL
ncbi:TonB-dependent receptor [Fusobacterium sp.]|uniref:TonB-dependent receptor family protein n=1 Tax=Fusobacterium sp. TaxID=68766 RepID=UPI0026151D48|nr:TonB-dependent receptor [Fusobacterium sp.]